MHCVVVGKKKKDIHVKRIHGTTVTYMASHLYALQVTIGYTVIFNALK